MYICPKCRKVFKVKNQSKNAKCSQCAYLLGDTGITIEEWSVLSKKEKEDIKDRICHEIMDIKEDAINEDEQSVIDNITKFSFFDPIRGEGAGQKNEHVSIKKELNKEKTDEIAENSYDYYENIHKRHMIIKCKMCGGDLQIVEGSSIATCEYCGSAQTVPIFDINSSKKINLFERANSLRIDCEFDKAEPIYESIIAEFPKEAEAYWGILLCKYGIEYVDDIRTGKKIPTCHRVSFDRVQNNFYYMKALEYADANANSIYKIEGNEIEQIRRKVIEVSNREDPYDIFICYKEKDENGERTEDSLLAEKIYDELTNKNYRVFFSRISLEDKIGEEYEPYIFAALNSARIMLVIGTNIKNYNAVWVRNEWSRYLDLIKSNHDKLLIPCYKNMDPYDLPKEFSGLQAQDIGKIGAVEDIVRGISKVIPRGTQKVGITEEDLRAVLKHESKKRTTRGIILFVTIGVAIAILGYVGISFLVTMIKNNKQETVVEKEAVIAPTPTPTQNDALPEETSESMDKQELVMNPNWNRTFVASKEPQNIEGAYDFYLGEECPFTLMCDPGDHQKEYYINKVEFSTVPLLSSDNTELYYYNGYLTFYFERGNMGSRAGDKEQYNGNIYFYDDNGIIAYESTILLKKTDNGKKVYDISSPSLPIGRYRIEISAR